MLILLSPAKKLGTDFPAAIQCTEPHFITEAQELVGGLQKQSSADLAELMSLSKNLADLTHARFQSWTAPAAAGQAVPSLFAFRGDVYSQMDAATFSNSDLDFSQKHLRILSGLYGLLRPMDWVMPYRLEMGTRWPNARGKNLYEFWESKISEAVNRQLQMQGDDVLINLASNEYFKAVKSDQIKGHILTPVFKEKKGDQYRVVSFCAKRARGMMSRYIIQNRCKDTANLKKFNQGGYIFQPKLSCPQEFVFTRSTE